MRGTRDTGARLHRWIAGVPEVLAPARLRYSGWVHRGIAIGAVALLLAATIALGLGLHHLSVAADGRALYWVVLGFAVLHASASLAKAGRLG